MLYPDHECFSLPSNSFPFSLRPGGGGCWALTHAFRGEETEALRGPQAAESGLTPAQPAPCSREEPGAPRTEVTGLCRGELTGAGEV